MLRDSPTLSPLLHLYLLSLPRIRISAGVIKLVSIPSYRHHDHFGVHLSLRQVGCAIEVPFQEIQNYANGCDLCYGPAEGNGVQPLGEDLSEDVDRHLEGG